MKTKTVAIFTAYGLWPMLEFELDIIQRELDNGNCVILLYCAGRQGYCPANNPKPKQKFKKRICDECISRVKTGINWLEHDAGKLIVTEFESISATEYKFIKDMLLQLDAGRKERDFIRQIVNIGAVDIFESAYSQLITELGDSRPKLEDNWELLRSLIEVGLISYYSARKFFRRYPVDRVYIFNGRFSKYRPLMRLSQFYIDDLRVYEYPRVGFENYTIVAGTYPHNFNSVSQQLKKFYDSKRFPNGVVAEEAGKWFEDRRNFRFDPLKKIAFEKTFSKIDKNEGLPSYWDNGKFNIVFFVSSETEKADIEENIRITPFKQSQAVRAVNYYFPEAVCIVRLHPHLQNKDAKFVTEMQALKNLRNVHVIPAAGSIDSYQIMLAADLVMTFGSTIGVEAAYRKKAVLNVGPALYSAFNCVACCYSKDEFITVLRAAIKKDFSYFPKIEQRYVGACQFAYAFLNHGVKPKYLEKCSYQGGVMVRQGVKKEIKAANWILIRNKLLRVIPRAKRIVRSLVCRQNKARGYYV